MLSSPWGDLPVSDAHVHFFSHGFLSGLAGQKGGLAPSEAARLLEWQAPPEDPGELGEIWARELDRHGVSRAVLIASLPGDEASVAAAVARFPARFRGYFMLDPTAEGAAARAAGALAGGRLRGICLFPAMHRYSVHDPRLEPILERAAAHQGALVFVHCGVLTVGFRKKLGLPSLFDLRFSNPIDLHPIALRYPKLSFVVPHFGAGYFRETLMLCDLCPNVYLDTSSTNSWMRYHPALNLEGVFARALEVAGPERLLFGTDSSFFPRGWQRRIFDLQIQALAGLGVGESAARAIFSGNLDRLLGF